MTDIEKNLIVFARWVISEHRSELGDIDGSDIQEKLVELGLLKYVRIENPCEGICYCAEEYNEFPVDCLRLVDGVIMEEEK